MKLEDIKKVATIGSGVIGSSWATGFALKGMEVNLYDKFPEALPVAMDRIKSNLEQLAANGVLDNAEIPAILERIHPTTDMKEAVQDVQFVQESVRENYPDKHSVVQEMEEFLPEDAIYSSSTSGLLITDIAKVAKHPERFCGGHPYNPPHLIPLVEITKGEKTSDETVALAKAFYTKMGKEPVVLQKEALGFISNRLQQALYREVCCLVMRGVCNIEDVDKAVTFGPGIRWGIMGPNLIFELGGGAGGLEGLFNNVGDSVKLWLADMADFKEYPAEWIPMAEAGVREAIKNRPAEIGNTNESLKEYRDKMLIGLLKLHGKL